MFRAILLPYFKYSIVKTSILRVVQSILEFGIIVWDGAGKNVGQPIFVTQKLFKGRIEKASEVYVGYAV